MRFLAISETKRGAELDEATVKQITGGDTISARAIYGRPFTYKPQFKIWMSTNHKPEIPDGSEAIWDRIKLIPFTQRFEGKKADTSLPEKLREEMSGILTWAVKGCVEWFEHGLGTSKAVEEATAEYRDETDVVERFFASECVFGPDKRISKVELWEAWESWAMDEGEESGKQVGFSRVMKERGVVKGFREARAKKGRVWEGIDVIKEGGVVSPDPGEQSKKPTENVPKVDTQDKVDTPKSPAKHGGVVDSVSTIEDFARVSVGTPSRREPLENSSKPDTLTPHAKKQSGRTFSFEGESE